MKLDFDSFMVGFSIAMLMFLWYNMNDIVSLFKDD